MKRSGKLVIFNIVIFKLSLGEKKVLLNAIKIVLWRRWAEIKMMLTQIKMMLFTKRNKINIKVVLLDKIENFTKLNFCLIKYSVDATQIKMMFIGNQNDVIYQT